MSDVNSILADLDLSINKIEASIKQHKGFLIRLNTYSLNPKNHKLNKYGIDHINKSIGQTTTRITEMRAYLAYKKRTRTKIKVNEFLIFPFMLVNKLLNLVKSEAH